MLRSEKILVADDDVTFASRLRGVLQRRQMTVALAVTLAEAFDQIVSSGPFRAFVFGQSLSGMATKSVLDFLRTNNQIDNSSVVVIDRRSNPETDRYWKEIEEARRIADEIDHLLGRSTVVEPHPRRCGPLIIDPENHEVRIEQKSLPLTPREIQVLYYLVGRLGELVKRDELLDAIWGEDRSVKTHIVDVYIERLRTLCLAETSELSFRTVPKMGYQLLLRRPTPAPKPKAK